MEEDIAIKVEGLSKKYFLQKSKNELDEPGKPNCNFWALKEVSFQVRKGDSIGIIGKNGSGKSTLLKILSGITKPTSGKVGVQGKIASILDIGAGFHPELTGRENVFLNGQLHGFQKDEIQSKLKEIIDFSGIEKFIDEPVKNYSNGMYLRLAFSIIAHLDFDIYLFDEVFNVGDVSFIQKTRNKFKELVASNKTILFVSHNINELQWNEKFMLLENGEINNNINQKNILSTYLEDSIFDDSVLISTQNTFITNFSNQIQSNEIRIVSIKLYQETTLNFQSNHEFIFEIEYERLNHNNTAFHPVLIISDIHENIILSSAPFLSEKLNENEQFDKMTYSCRIPPNFFNSQVYKLGVCILKNIKANNSLNTEQITTDNFTEKTGAEIVLYWNDLISFKPIFKNENFEIDLSQLDLKGALLPAFNWKSK
jgi:lipopolysaccharide transport system ATP-binding protein